VKTHCPHCAMTLTDPRTGCRSCTGEIAWEKPGGAPGRLFGAALGAGVTIAAWALIGPWMMTNPRPENLVFPGLYWVLCATLLGAYTGGVVRGRQDRLRTLFFGIVGPSLTALGLFGVAALVCYFPFFFAFSLPAVAFALPCAYLTERFNDPACWNPGRRRTWLRFALALPAFSFLIFLVLYGLASRW
jgi:hypothetical protein